MSSLLADISFEELEIFSLLYREKSVREVARRRHQSPSHISKHLKSLELKLRSSLFVRTQQNLMPTIEAAKFAETAKRLIDLLQVGVEDIHNLEANAAREIISIGTISFLASHLAPAIIPRFAKAAPKADLRIVEFTHNKLVSHGIEGAFGCALHIGPLDWPKSWETKSLGHLRWSLFASTRSNLEPIVSLQQALMLKFVVPIDWKGGDYVVGSDFCPLNVHERLKGHEVFTADTAIEVVTLSDQVTYVPDIIAANAVSLGKIRRIEVDGWPVTKQEIFLSVHRDSITKRQFELLYTAYTSCVTSANI